MIAKPGVVLRDGEVIRIRMNNGQIYEKIGDGVTPIIDLPYNINSEFAERAESAAVTAEAAAETAATEAREAADEQIAQRVSEIGNIVHTLGDSPTQVISQDGVTRVLEELVTTQKKLVFGGSYSGTLYQELKCNIPVGSYELHIDNFESTDTDETRGQIVFIGGDTTLKGLYIERNKPIYEPLVFSSPVDTIRIYASINYANSVGDTYSVSGLRIVGDTVLSERLDESIDTKNRLNAHVSDGSAHLKTKITSNNLLDKSKVEDGGYYVYNTGKWAARSDIASTGLIPCEKGRTYYSVHYGVTFGGNLTFWNKSGEYLSGVDVVVTNDDANTSYTIPDNDEIKYFRISFYNGLINGYQINEGEVKAYDEYADAYYFDKEIVAPNAETSEKDIVLNYAQTYKDDISVLHKRNNKVGTSYQITVVNKTKFDGTATKVTVEGTSTTSDLGDGNNTNIVRFAKANEFLHVINGGIFLTVGDNVGQADGITIIDGNILKSTGVEQFTKEQYVLGIKADGTMKTYINETAQNILADGSVYAITGFVPLIQDGIAVDNTILAICPHYNERHPRQIIGILADGNYFTFCCDGRTDGENGMTLAECIETIAADFKVTFAFNLDGGGSTQTAVGKKQTNRVIDGRSFPNVIAFK